MERCGTSHNKLEEAETWPETTPNKLNKEKLPSWWATNDIECHSVILGSVNFDLK